MTGGNWMDIRRASVSELNTVIRLRRQAAAWLARQGTDQWSSDWPDTATMIYGFALDLDAGNTWFALTDNDHVYGCITIDTSAAEGLWSPEEASAALFVHRLTVDRAAAGNGIGALLLDFAAHRAEYARREWLRLDAWTTNTRLHDYYLRQGFRHVRTVENHHTPSAACFERHVSARGGDR